MADKVPISYLALGIYLTFVIVSTLLVGLLPALVNLPECSSNSNRDLVAEIAPAVVPVQEQKVHRLKRTVEKMTPETIQLISEMNKRGREVYERNLQTNPVFARLAAQKQPKAFPQCPEIQSPVLGVEYPW